MTPTADTLSALLALPIEARRYLAERSTGPGWLLHTRLTGGINLVMPDLKGHARYLTLRDGEGWLPCDPCEIVRLAVAVRCGDIFSAEIADGGTAGSFQGCPVIRALLTAYRHDRDARRACAVECERLRLALVESEARESRLTAELAEARLGEAVAIEAGRRMGVRLRAAEGLRDEALRQLDRAEAARLATIPTPTPLRRPL